MEEFNFDLLESNSHFSSFIYARIISHRPITIFGENISWKIHPVQSFTEVIRVPHGIIQFYSDTDSSSIIYSLEIDGNIDESQNLRELVQSFADKLIHFEHSKSVLFSSSYFSEVINFEQINQILSDIILYSYSINPNMSDNSILSQEDFQKVKELIQKISDFQIQSIRNFVFKEGILLKMIREGG
jgi:hypothetical protein